MGMFGNKPTGSDAEKIMKEAYDKSVEIAKAFQSGPDNADDAAKNKAFAKEQITRGKKFVSLMKKFTDDFDLDL